MTIASSDAAEILQKAQQPFATAAKHVGLVTKRFVDGSSSAVNKIQPVVSHYLPAKSKYTILGRNRDDASNGDATPEDEGISASLSSGLARLAMPPDERLRTKMQIVMQKTLHSVSMDKLCTACWSEGEFYKRWLENDGTHDIVVGGWEIDGFVGPWRDKEAYSQKRVVTYIYDRNPGTPGYSMGKPQVLCTQTQYFGRQHNDDRSMIALTLSTDGEVIADAILVHIRGVATQLVGTKEGALQLDFGVFCQFTRQVLLACQTKNITNDATVDMLLTLYEQVKEECHATEDTQVSDVAVNNDCVGKNSDETSPSRDNQNCNPCPWLHFCNSHMKQDEAFMDDIDHIIWQIKQKFGKVLKIKPGNAVPLETEITKTEDEFKLMLEALDGIMNRDCAPVMQEIEPIMSPRIGPADNDDSPRIETEKVQFDLRWIRFRPTIQQ